MPKTDAAPMFMWYCFFFFFFFLETFKWEWFNLNANNNSINSTDGETSKWNVRFLEWLIFEPVNHRGAVHDANNYFLFQTQIQYVFNPTNKQSEKITSFKLIIRRIKRKKCKQRIENNCLKMIRNAVVVVVFFMFSII